MEIVIITGMSGAGKTSAINICQDNDYYSVDNLPPKLIGDYLNFIKDNGLEKDKFAFVIDIRMGEFLKDMEISVETLRAKGHDVKVVFIDASDNVLVKRFQEKRRPHIFDNMPLEEAIQKERKDLSFIKNFADQYINTTNKSLSELKLKLLEILGINQVENIKIISFGFKNGQLLEADYIFDVRFFDNPYYISEMRSKSGKDKIVEDYVKGLVDFSEFIKKSMELLDYIIPRFKKSGKSNLVIGIGCTGGKHRSVVIAEELNRLLKERYNTQVFHREEKMW